jgi:hypothetical protein
MKIDWLQDALFLIGLAGIGFGAYHEFGPGWASLVVGFILLSVSIYGCRET